MKEEEFQKIAFPIIRKLFPALIANELLSVQPMTLPTNFGNWFNKPDAQDQLQEMLYSLNVNYENI